MGQVVLRKYIKKILNLVAVSRIKNQHAKPMCRKAPKLTLEPLLHSGYLGKLG